MRDGFIYTEGNGHLIVFKKDFLANSQVDPKKYLLTDADIATIKAASADPAVRRRPKDRKAQIARASAEACVGRAIMRGGAKSRSAICHRLAGASR